MLTLFLLKGILVGLSISAPVGPIGFLCIRRTLNGGMASGVSTGLGAAIGDAFYGAVAAFSIVFVLDFINEHTQFIKVVGGIALVFIGYKIITKPIEIISETQKESATKLIKNIFGTCFLTLSSPATIFLFIAVFASFGRSLNGNFLQSLSVVIGVFVGSLLWWVFLSGLISKIKHMISEKSVALINKVSGLVIIAFGILSVVSIIQN